MTRVFSARVQGGVIVAEGLDLPEGTAVTVAANEGELECELPADELAELDAAIAAADSDESEPTPHEAVLAELDRMSARR